MKKGDKIIWDSHFEYELGYFLSDNGVMFNTYLVKLVTGIVHGEVSHSINEIKSYTPELHQEMIDKYHVLRTFPIKPKPVLWKQKIESI